MPDQPKTFYLTTPIYYVNARPHIGHAYTTIVGDVLARRHRLLGEDVFFLTGTDEHGQKIERSAAAAGVPPQQFADQVSASFEALWKRMGITHNDYIRTTEPRHKLGAQKLFTTLYENGFIYLASYTGSYCVSDEAFVDAPVGTPCPDCGRLLEEVTEENFFFKLSEFQKPLIDLIESGKLVITPEAARNEVLRFLRGRHIVNPSERPELYEKNGDNGHIITDAAVEQHRKADLEEGKLKLTEQGNLFVPGALKDLSISRSSFTWGIPVPEPAASLAKQPHVIYVWLDALANYMTALGYGAVKGDGTPDDALWQKFWPADLHLVGKEITRFHCVYWPAFLLAAGIETPKQITANGWLLFDNSKMSKSKGNIVRTETILDAFGTLCPPPPIAPTPNGVILSEGAGHHPAPQSKDLLAASPATTADTFSNENPTKADRDLFAADILRYYLLREIPFGQDGSFSFEALITRYNADLANGYGNLVSRVLNMIQQYFSGEYQSFKTDFYFDFVMYPGTPNHNWISFGNIDAFRRDPVAMERADNQEPGDSLAQAIETYVYDCQFTQATELLMQAVTAVDGYLTQHAPWKIAKQEGAKDKLAEVLMNAAEAIKYITACAHDILPYATARVWAQLGLGDIKRAADNGELTNLQWGGLQPGTKLGPLAPIFPRAPKELAQIMTDMENPQDSKLENSKLETQQSPALDTTAPNAPPRAIAPLADTLPVAGSHAHTTGPDPTLPAGEPGPAPTDASPTIAIDDFAKIDLRVAQILVAERIPKADKLLRLEVDLGPLGHRQILSGIAEFYTPEELIGRRIVVITNLAPRKMRGLESHGMLLAASADDAADGKPGKPILATMAEDIALGSRLK